jgi:class 3 adenylate cyclase
VRVTRSFVFLDLCGFTSYTESHGDREAVAIVAMLRRTLRASAEEHGVRVTKWPGGRGDALGYRTLATLSPAPSTCA